MPTRSPLRPEVPTIAAFEDLADAVAEIQGGAVPGHTHTSGQITDFAGAVDARIQQVVGTAPAALDTLGELADALGDDADFAASVTTALAGKQAVSAVLTALSALSPTGDAVLVYLDGQWRLRSFAQFKADLDISEGGESGLPKFDVEQHGAVGDGVTDDYAAILSAWNALKAFSLKGRLFFPRLAEYVVVATVERLSTVDGCYALFPIPMVPTQDGPLKRTYMVQGVGDPYVVRTASTFGAGTAPAQVATASILRVDYDVPFEWSPTNGLPSIFGAPDADITGHTTDNIVTNVHFGIRDLIVRQPDDPSLCDFNLELVSTCVIESLRCDVDVVLDNVSLCTHPTGGSVVLPKSNNNVAVLVDRMVVEGRYFGGMVTEHGDVRTLICLRCRIGVANRRACTHGSDMFRVKLEQCLYGLAGWDPAGEGPALGVVPWVGAIVKIHTLNFEHFGYLEARPEIYTPAFGADIYAPDGGLTGSASVYRVNSENPSDIGVPPYGGSGSVYVVGQTGVAPPSGSDAGTGLSDFGIFTYSMGTAQRFLGHHPANPVVDPPDAPTIGAATAGVQAATVTFTPAGTGPAATSFTATAYNGANAAVGTATGASSPLTVTGLTAGVAVTLKVKANNTVGSSAESAASNSVTPTAPAGLPADDFDRADGPPGTSSSGATWLGNSGGLWAVVSNQFRHGNGGDPWTNAVWLDAGTADVREQIDMQAIASLEAGPVIRVVDAANYLYMDLILDGTGASVTVEIYRRVAGSFTAVGAPGGGNGGSPTLGGLTPGSMMALDFSANGTTVSAKVNGVELRTATDSTTGTGVGVVYGANNACVFDNLVATAV
ncbi:MAG: hypothetical protein HOY78_02455 [Saccharothrix sp.]|nr:hypothetical protein [Saccharothrix sp.]